MAAHRCTVLPPVSVAARRNAAHVLWPVAAGGLGLKCRRQNAVKKLRTGRLETAKEVVFLAEIRRFSRKNMIVSAPS
jgi:hypothetical protein